MSQKFPEDRAPYGWHPVGNRSQLCIFLPWNLQLAVRARHPGYTHNCKIQKMCMRKQPYIIGQNIWVDIAGTELANKLTHPGEQLPVGVSRPEELQYLPGGQGTHWSLLDRPNWPLKVPTGQGKLTPDSEPVQNTKYSVKKGVKCPYLVLRVILSVPGGQ